MMASICRKPGKTPWWATYYLNGKRVRHSLRTRGERIARKKLKKLEGDLVTGELQQKTTTHTGPFLEESCDHLATIRSPKAYKNDISYLRTFFRPVCDGLKPKSTVNRRFQPRKKAKVPDRPSHRHISVSTLEQLTSGKIEKFITSRITEDGISSKTANRTREVLRLMFNYAIRQHGFRSLDRRFPNPADAMPRRKEPDHQIRFLNLKQIAKQLKVLKGEPLLKAMVAVYSCLMRFCIAALKRCRWSYSLIHARYVPSGRRSQPTSLAGRRAGGGWRCGPSGRAGRPGNRTRARPLRGFRSGRRQSRTR